MFIIVLHDEADNVTDYLAIAYSSGGRIPYWSMFLSSAELFATANEAKDYFESNKNYVSLKVRQSSESLKPSVKKILLKQETQLGW